MAVLKKIKIAIIGATGYTGLDLVYLLSNHPKVKIMYLCATKNIGKKITYFDKRITKNLPKISKINKINWNNLDLVFLSLPNGKAQEMIKRTFNKYKNIKFIDLSADFRIEDSITYKKNYKKQHKAKELIKKSLYSISEFNKKKKLKIIELLQIQGCYPTSIQLPLIPLIKKKLIITENITIDSKSGYSGAGKNFEKNLIINFYMILLTLIIRKTTDIFRK